IEKSHIIRAFRFELGKVENVHIRVRMIGLIAQVDENLAQRVAEGLGITTPPEQVLIENHGVAPDGPRENQMPQDGKSRTKKSKPLSMLEHPTVQPTIETRKIAIICTEGVN